MYECPQPRGTDTTKTFVVDISKIISKYYGEHSYDNHYAICAANEKGCSGEETKKNVLCQILVTDMFSNCQVTVEIIE